MSTYFINDFYVKGSNNQYQKIKAFLNQLCGIENDNITKTEFTFGIINDLGDLRFYIKVDDSFEYILKEQLKLIFEGIEFEEMEYNAYKLKMMNNSKFQRLKLLKSPDTKLLTTEPNQIFMENLANAIYSKNDHEITMVEINLKPIVITDISKKRKDQKKIANKTLTIAAKSAEFLLDSILYSNNSNNNKDKDNKQKVVTQAQNTPIFEYKVSINIGTMNKESDDKELTKKIRNISSIFSQLNCSTKFLSEPTSIENMFCPQYNMTLTTDEIYQFVYLPEHDVIDNILGASEFTVLIDKNIPKEGIHVGSYNDIDYYIATPTIIMNHKNYKDVYNGKSIVCDNEIANSQIIDNLCKTRLIEGVPGTGKSETITNIAISGLRRGLPFILIDPKYDTQKRLIESIPEQYINNVDFLDLGDILYPPSLNIFRRRKNNDTTENALITTNFISYMKKQFDRNWGYNIERMIQMTTDAILLDDISTVSEFYWMLTEQNYRITILQIINSKLQEPNVENKSRLKQLYRYWNDFEERYKKNPITVNKEIETVMNKIGVFIGNRFINAIVSQRESYDFKQSGDMGRSVIINIPEGLISRDNMSLLSGFVTKAIWTDYQSRDDMDMARRYPVQWLIDEASTIVDDEIVDIMQKARSRRLGLTLITQTLASLNMRGTNIGDIIADNCKTKLIYKIGARDASYMVNEFAPLTIKDFTDCPDYHFYGKILLPDGRVSKPFFAKSPMPHSVIRNYDTYKQNHRSGKMTINEIEEDIDSRLERFLIADMLQ